MPKDLRTYLTQLESDHPDEMVRVTKEVDPSWEIAAIVRRFQADKKFPAILFEKVRGHDIPVLTNLFASRQKMALAFDTTPDRMIEEYTRREENPIPPEVVSTGPVKEVRYVGDQVDMSRLPIVTHGDKDGGPYIGSGVGITRDPDNGVYNAGMYRMQYKGKRKMGIDLGPESHALHFLKKMAERGEDLECAVAIGHHPVVCHGTQAKTSVDSDELSIIGGLLGEPLRVTQCETIDVMAPADSEIILEGKILSRVREPEGPFGEFTWYYGSEVPSPVFEVSAVTHRSRAILHDIYNPFLDHNYCGGLGREATLFRQVKRMVPTVTAVCMPPSGGCRFSAYVQMKKEYEGQAKNAAIAAMSADPYIKVVVVVDEDVDIFDEERILWAINTRTQPDRDFFYIPEAFTSGLDTSAHTPDGRLGISAMGMRAGLNTKLAIDATKPYGVPFAEVCEVSRWNEIRYEDLGLVSGHREKAIAR